MIVLAAFLQDLVVVGGGSMGPEIVKKILELGKGPVLVIPQASGVADAGAREAKMWRDAGAAQVASLDLADPKAAVEQVRSAGIIWIGGGQQTQLMRALDKTGVPEAIRERHAKGAVVAGSSAGAAVMSKLMITGEADLDAIRPGATKTSEGLGLWPEVIVDQHFLKRGRFNRLLSLVLDHPELVGVGIDEGTAVVVRGTQFEVLGKSSVVVIDARKASGSTNVLLHVLKSGMKFDLGK